MKEVVYTIAFLILAVLLGILIYFMFGPGKSQTTSAAGEGIYTPGVYRSSLTLNKNTFDVEVTVDRALRKQQFPLPVHSHTALHFP